MNSKDNKTLKEALHIEEEKIKLPLLFHITTPETEEKLEETRYIIKVMESDFHQTTETIAVPFNKLISTIYF